MPSIVPRIRNGRALPETLPQALSDIQVAFPEIVGRNCTLNGDYQKVDVPSVKVTSDIVAYCSPDSTFAVTKRLFDAAQKSILIGIYDFSAPHVKELLLQAMGRGVKVQLMLDIDNDDEQELFDELVSLGVTGVPAPSCASKSGNKVFRSSHEKVIVIDGEWTLVQSGNYSSNSCPFNTVDGGDKTAFKPGNRDTGMAVRSKALAKFFTRILSSDMDLELSGPEHLAVMPQAAAAFLVEKAPRKLPSKLSPSKTFKVNALDVQPVLSPDNYMKVVPGLLRNARNSILIQQQYIRAQQDKVKDLMDSIGRAKKDNAALDVRILLGKIFSKKDLPKEKEMLEHLEETYGLKLGRNIRYVNTDRLVHCHNKMVLVDDAGVLVSSQNWSSAAVWENREAGLVLHHKGISSYFRSIFETDWKDGHKTLAGPAPEVLAPQTMQSGGYIRVEPGDYAEV